MVWENVADIDLFQGLRAPASDRERRYFRRQPHTQQNRLPYLRPSSPGVHGLRWQDRSALMARNDPALGRLLAPAPHVTYLGTLNQRNGGRNWQELGRDHPITSTNTQRACFQ